MKLDSSVLLKKLQREKLLPLYTVHDLDYLDKLEEVLLENGLTFVEVTYRSSLATKAIKQLSTSGKLIVGAGTVTDVTTAQLAIENGAKFIVSPGLSKEIVEFCNKEDILCIPGAVTPTEIMKAINLGLGTVKFFPSDIYGGLSAIKALSGPFANIKFLPTGGIDENNYEEYLDNNSVLAVGGSFIISEEKLKNEDSINAINQSIKYLVKGVR